MSCTPEAKSSKSLSGFPTVRTLHQQLLTDLLEATYKQNEEAGALSRALKSSLSGFGRA